YIPSDAYKSQPKSHPDFPTCQHPIRRAIDHMHKAKTKNLSLPTSAASRHTTPLRGYFLSSRFICEATNHSSSRFCYEATGEASLRPDFCLMKRAEGETRVSKFRCARNL